MDLLKKFLLDNELEKYETILIENDINTAELLTELTEDDLKELGFSLGDRKRFAKGKNVLQNNSTASLTESDITLLAALPYVIAYPLKRTLEEKHAWTKINLLKDTFLNYLKYLGLLTASEFFNSKLKNRRMVDAFQKNLAQPSFGSWNAFIRECIAFLKEQNHVFFYPELVSYYEAIETGNKRKLFKGEIEYIDANGDAQLKKQETTAIGLLINFRNRYLGHGLTLDEQASSHLWEEYFPVFKNLLEQMSFVSTYPMLKREHGVSYLLQGIELKETNAAHTFEGSIWIENKEGEAFEILPFYIVPGALALTKEDKEQILSYESFTGKTIKFFSPEGTEKQTSGQILDKLNLLLRDKQKEISFSPEIFTKELFLERITEENNLVLDTLYQEKKVIKGIYQHRESIEIKLREWIGARANIFFIAAEAGSGKTNLLVEIQKQYTERKLPSLLIRAARMEKSSLKEQLAYQLNLDSSVGLENFTSIAGTQAEPTFILIDGLNEASNAEAIWLEILELSELFDPGSLKFVVSNRANSKADLERYVLAEKQEQFIYGDQKENLEKGLAAFVFWLTPMDMKEMEGAWESYIKQDKTRFKPLFSFNDLATFDRALYLQINSPLVLRIFLETYQGKNLPKKGAQHLHIWKDWFATFSSEEQSFMRLLADAVWEKGENELLLDELHKNEQLNVFISSDNISGPFQRLINKGWIGRYHKDLSLYVSFTVEGLLLYLLGLKLNQQEIKISTTEISELLTNGNKLQKSAIESFLCEQALGEDLHLVTDLIDAGNEDIDLCIKPLLLCLKTFGVKETVTNILATPTENDWKAILKLHNRLNNLQLQTLKKEFLREVMPYNTFDTKDDIFIGLKAIALMDKEEAISYLNKIDTTSSNVNEDSDLLNQLGNCEVKFGNYEKALDFCQKCLDIQLKTLGEEHPSVATSYNNIGLTWDSKGEYDKAFDYYEKCLDIRLKTLGSEHPSVATSYNNIGGAWNRKGEYEKALDFYQKCLDIQLKALGSEHPSVATSYNNIGGAWESKGDIDRALDYNEKGLSILLKTLGDEHLKISEYRFKMGNTCFKMKNYTLAIKYFENALKFLKKGGIPFKVAQCYEALKDQEKALAYYIQSAEIRKEDPKVGLEHHQTKESIKNVLRLAKELNKENELPEWIK